ncbi:MAG TPA: hypothetical protein VK092_03720, partial [Deinococcales bacterium]|nr:hypothetical protein [Deinococcales bacterium]
MSEQRKDDRLKETERVRGSGMGHQTMVGQKALNFGPTIRRLLGMLRPDRIRLIFIVIAAIISVGLSSVAPRVLGQATDLLFAGVIGRQLPEGITKEEAIAGAQAT